MQPKKQVQFDLTGTYTPKTIEEQQPFQVATTYETPESKRVDNSVSNHDKKWVSQYLESNIDSDLRKSIQSTQEQATNLDEYIQIHAKSIEPSRTQ